jgi:hypothetical protein
MDDMTFAAWICAMILIGLPVAGFSLGGFEGGVSMIFFSLILLPVVLFALGSGMFFGKGDMYG